MQRILREESSSGWVESSGLLQFLSTVPREVETFEHNFGFGLRYIDTPPDTIDGKEEDLLNFAFMVLRDNRVIPERRYCLYCILRERMLYGYIGVYIDGDIQTLWELQPISDFKRAGVYDWLRGLVKASCEKF